MPSMMMLLIYCSGIIFIAFSKVLLCSYFHYRVHAEFQLNSVPDYPFWFTPAQFSGRIIMNHDSEHIYYFELELPTDHLLNIGILTL